MISIVIPIYNGEKYIKECVQNIIRKSIAEYEILLINDGSTDVTQNICQELAYEYDFVRYIYKENGGVSSARNKGIQEAKGEWILFVDVDDYLNLTLSLDLFHSDADIIVFSKEFNGVNTCENDDRIKTLVCAAMKKSNNSTLNSVYLNTVWSKAYNLEFIKKSGVWFEEQLVNGEDEIFNISLILKAKKIVLVGVTIYKWRYCQQSATKKYQKGIIEADTQFLVKISEVFKLNNMWNDMEDLYNELAVNGLWIILYQNIGHHENAIPIKEKYNKYKELENSVIYNQALKKLYKLKLRLPIKREAIFWLLKLKLYQMAFLILIIDTSRKSSKKEYFVEI